MNNSNYIFYFKWIFFVFLIIFQFADHAYAQKKWYAFSGQGRGGLSDAKQSAQIKQLQQYNTDRWNENKTQETRLDTLETDVGDHAGRITTNEGNISSLQTDMASVEQHAKETAVSCGAGQKMNWNGAAWECLPLGESDPTVQNFAKTTLPSCTASQLLRAQGGSLQCVSGGSNYVITESDPEVGATTSGKWCKGSGGTVECSYDGPDIGATANDKICYYNGLQVNCSSPAPTVLSGGSLSVPGTVSAANPTATTHLTTKGYVDAAVASAGGAGGAPSCYYTSPVSGACGAGFQKMPGEFRTSGGVHGICCSSAGGGTSGFFVMISAYNGNLGGLSGANAKCLTSLTNSNWLGKGVATLNSSTVKAWLCDSSTCQDPKPSTTYYVAKAGDLSVGGGSFTTDMYGRGPGDTNSWNSSIYFNDSGTYWTGRLRGSSSTLWPGTGDPGNTCNSWTSTASGLQGQVGRASNTQDRWGYPSTNWCASSRPLICIVDPL